MIFLIARKTPEAGFWAGSSMWGESRRLLGRRLPTYYISRDAAFSALNMDRTLTSSGTKYHMHTLTGEMEREYLSLDD